MMENAKIISCLLLFGAALTFGCTQDPKSDEAEVGEAQEVKATENNAAIYTIDQSQSAVTWVGTKPTGRHEGKFPIKKGTLQVRDNNLIGGSILLDISNLVVIDTEISAEDLNKFIGHLKSKDFFDVANHPDAKFEITKVEGFHREDSTDIEVDTEFKLANPTHKITGNLTLRDSTRSISFPAIVNISQDQVQAKAKFNIDRTDWGVSYGDENAVTDKAKDKFIYNKVNLGFDIKASK